MEYDFKGALDAFDPKNVKHAFPDENVFCVSDSQYDATQVALRLADRLQSGEVSEGMCDAAMHPLYFNCPPKLEQRAEFAFKTMAAQLLKEIEDE